MVTDRPERRMALRLGAERAALPLPDEPADQVATLPSVAALAAGPRPLSIPGTDVDSGKIDIGPGTTTPMTSSTPPTATATSRDELPS
jgi:hypothetical protein